MNFLKKNLSDKDFNRNVLRVAVPMMIQGLVVSLSALVDNLMVAGLGDQFLSGVAAANRFYIIFNFGVNGIMQGSGVFIGQYRGANNEEKMQESFRSSIILGFLMMIPFFIITYLFSDKVLAFFTNDAAVINAGIEYFRAIVWTYIPVTLTLAISNAIRATGDTRTPVFASIIGIAVNIFFNYCLIFGNFGFPAWGVFGGGVGTLISRIVEVIILLILLKIKKYPFNTRVRDLFKVDRVLFDDIKDTALSVSLNEILWAASMAALMKFYSTRGAAAMSAYSIAGSIADIFYVLFGGMSAATTVLVGHHLGADSLEVAKDNGYKLLSFSVVLAFGFGISMLLISFFIPSIYGHVSIEAQHIAVKLVRIIGIFFWTYMYNYQILYLLRVGGDSRSAFIMDSGFMWLINLPLVGVFTYFTGFSVVTLYFIGQMTDVIKILVSTHVFKKEHWVRNITAVKALD